MADGMQNGEIADILEEMATLYELRGENPFKCRAFRNAARLIANSAEDLKSLASTGTLTGLKGIGKGLAPVIADLALRGNSEEYRTLRGSVPEGLMDMLKVQGLGPGTVRMLYEKLGINSLDKLRKAASGDALLHLPGFGEKSRNNLVKNLALLDRYNGRHLIREAEEAADLMLGKVSAIRGVSACSLAGSIRRRMPVIGDIDIVAAAPAKEHRRIIREMTSFPETERVLASGDTKASVLLRSGIQCDLRVVTRAAFPYALQYFTGSKEHNVQLRARALAFGWSLNEYGMKVAPKGSRSKARSGGRSSVRHAVSPPPCRSEDDVYRALGLNEIPPELREATGEIAAASVKGLPSLIRMTDLKGTFHCHTTFSDGRNTIGEMARAARELGWEYLGIADHSKAAAYAGGLSEDDVSRQIEEIRALNARMGKFRIFAGTEVDILADGTLDWSRSILARFDYVVASIHSGFRMTAREATRRVVRALENRYVTMLGHPTGRLLLEREGYPVDLRAVIDAAAACGKIIEINANPRRLDLDWSHCRYAAERGVLISINPDAHRVAGLRDVRFGIGVARKGWLEPRHVLNTRSLGDVSRILSP
jgi:DNA polymerase (family 10)